jgi:hypothetical protein
MLRRSSIFVLIFAALLAIEPVMHRHSLQQSNGGASDSCAICAAGTARLPIVTASVAAPQIVAYTITIARVHVVSVDVVLPLPSRAPPAA